MIFNEINVKFGLLGKLIMFRITRKKLEFSFIYHGTSVICSIDLPLSLDTPVHKFNKFNVS